MEIQEPRLGRYEHGDAERFTGDVWLAPGRSTPDGTGMTVVHFTPGARTHWHRHEGGQLLYVLSGRGRIRSRDGAGHVLVPGEIVLTPPGAWHYHGAGPDCPVVHVAVNVGAPPQWGEPVTDGEYDEGF